ncbi:MAG: hypothetical protein KatS3mg114_0211 [Planctomycetaceae bacterium]|nr:MAG: hypothetical protein KatS3mg114_0211 [Planctomycetaceae bacterium]
MDITEIRIKLMEDPSERLLAFCSITLDGKFVIRDLKIIQGTKGCFVAMPSRKLMDRCPSCGAKNHLRARYCNECGVRLAEERVPRQPSGRVKLYADIAHPINTECRLELQRKILTAYAQELERSKQPGYVCTYDDYDDTFDPTEYEETLPITPPVIPLTNGVRRRDPGNTTGPAAPHVLQLQRSPEEQSPHSRPQPPRENSVNEVSE